MDTGSGVKQQTALASSVILMERLHALRDRLDESFRRGAKGEPEICQERPDLAPNVLDELIANLESANKDVADITAYVVGDIIQKIHNQ